MKSFLAFFILTLISFGFSPSARAQAIGVEDADSARENAKIDNCAKLFTGDYKNPKLIDPNSSQQCMSACSTSGLKDPFNKSVIEVYLRACKGSVYNCTKLGECRSAVDDLLSCKRGSGMDCNPVAKICKDACTPASGNNCVAGDLENFKQGREICATGAPARTMISQQQAQTIIEQRAQETVVANNGQGAMPSEETSTQSVFYGAGGASDTGDGDAKGSAGSTNGGSESSSDTGTASTNQQQQQQNQQTPFNASGLNSSSSSSSTSGGALAGFTPSGLNLGGSSSGGSSGTSYSGLADTGSKSYADDAVSSARLASDNFSGEQWGDAPASRNYGSGSSSGGSVSGGATPFPSGGGSSGGSSSGGSGRGYRTASVGRRGSSSMEGSSFQSGFHKANGSTQPGQERNGKKASSAAKKRAASTAAKRRKRSDGSMNLAKLLAAGKKRGLAGKRGSGASSSGWGYGQDVGSGAHPVFTNVNGYFQKIRLDMNGDMEL